MNDENQKEILLTELDYLVADPHIQMMKAAVPYMQPPQQRIAALMIRLQEMNRTMALFRGGDVAAMGLSPSGNAKASPVEMLQAMKPFAGPKEREFIEMLENLQIMMQAMQTQT
ncbi:MAG: hypothetical protein MR868_07145 [Lachnospiraceae bacterium]|nr:hypothetical protein [Lachnospiraceae bacterium]